METNDKLSAAPQPPTVSTQGWQDGSVAGEIMDAFQVEVPDQWLAFSECAFECGFEWNFKDGSKLWLDFSRDGKISLLWRKGADAKPRVLSLRSIPDIDALTRERDQAREALAPFVSGPRHEIRRVSSLDDNCGTFIHVEVRESDLDRACSIIQRSNP